MIETRKFTAIALGVSALSMIFMAVAFPSIATADRPQNELTSMTNNTGAGEWPWNGPDQTARTSSDLVNDEWPWNGPDSASRAPSHSVDDEWPWNY